LLLEQQILYCFGFRRSESLCKIMLCFEAVNLLFLSVFTMIYFNEN